MPSDLPKGLDAQHEGNRPHDPAQRPSDDVNEQAGGSSVDRRRDDSHA